MLNYGVKFGLLVYELLWLLYWIVYGIVQQKRTMSGSTTLTVRLRSDTKDQLAVLAGRTRRTSSFLAAEAITAYVARELAIAEAVEQGRVDLRAGRFTPQEDVAREARAIIAATRAKR